MTLRDFKPRCFVAISRARTVLEVSIPRRESVDKQTAALIRGIAELAEVAEGYAPIAANARAEDRVLPRGARELPQPPQPPLRVTLIHPGVQ
jgi:hypothetical protein